MALLTESCIVDRFLLPHLPATAWAHVIRKRARTTCYGQQSSSNVDAGIHKASTYLGENFTKTVPKRRGAWETDGIDAFEGGPIFIQRLDHCAVEVTDVEKSIRFYTKVLGFERLARPGFPFGGAWLNAGGLTLHLIEKDPSVDRNIESREGVFSDPPEPWYIRRSEHKAFQVADLDATEKRLAQAGVEFHKFLVPGTSAAQIFLFDPDLNGIELGAHYAEIEELLQDKEP